MDAPTYQDLFRVARDAMLMNNSKITKAAIERPGTDLNAIANSAAAVGDEVVGQNVKICSANFLESARGDALTKYVFDRYGLVKKPAAAAMVSAVFSLPTAAALNLQIPSGFKLATSDGVQFVTTADATLAVGQTSVSVACRSVLAGSAYQAQANTLTSMIDTVVSAPTGLSVTNPLASSGADDAETEDELRARARNFYNTVVKGTGSAVQQKALAYPGVKKATVIEELDEYGRPARLTRLVITDAFTEALVGTTSLTYATQSQLLADAVFNSLVDTRASGIFVNVLVAQVIMQAVVLALSFDPDVDPDDTALRARAAIVSYINSLAPNDPFVPAEAVEVLRRVQGLIVTGDEILSPSGTVVPTVGQVLRSTLRLVRASTVQPDRALQGSANSDI